MSPVLVNPSRFGGAPPASYDAEVTADAPVGRWKHDETSGNTCVAAVGTNGGYFNSVTVNVSPLLTDGGHACSCAGSTSFVTLGTVSVPNAAGSIVNWFASLSTTTPWLWHDTNTGSSAGWGVYLGTTNPIIWVNGTSHTVTAVASSAVVDGARHRSLLKTDGSTVTWRIDGATIDSWANASAWSTIGTAGIRLSRAGSTATYGKFTLDDTAVYDYALSDARDNTQYAAGIA